MKTPKSKLPTKCASGSQKRRERGQGDVTQDRCNKYRTIEGWPATCYRNVEISKICQSNSHRGSNVHNCKMPAEKLLDPRMKPAAMIVNNASSQALMKDHEAGLRTNVSEESMDFKLQNVKSPNYVTRAEWLTLAILTFVNLINYMDRYTIAGKS